MEKYFVLHLAFREHGGGEAFSQPEDRIALFSSYHNRSLLRVGGLLRYRDPIVERRGGFQNLDRIAARHGSRH